MSAQRARRGALRAYPTLLRVGLAEAVAYRAEFLVWMLTTTMPLVMLALMSAVAREGHVGRFDRHGFVAYYLATLIVRQMTGAWVVWEMNREIKEGTLALRLLRPIHPLVSYSADALAAMPMRALVALPIAVGVLVAAAGQRHHARSGERRHLRRRRWLGAWLLNFAVSAIIGTLGALHRELAAGLGAVARLLHAALGLPAPAGAVSAVARADGARAAVRLSAGVSGRDA